MYDKRDSLNLWENIFSYESTAIGHTNGYLCLRNHYIITYGELERTLCLKQVVGIKHVVVNTWHDVDIQNIMSRIISSNNKEYYIT